MDLMGYFNCTRKRWYLWADDETYKWEDPVSKSTLFNLGQMSLEVQNRDINDPTKRHNALEFFFQKNGDILSRVPVVYVFVTAVRKVVHFHLSALGSMSDRRPPYWWRRFKSLKSEDFSKTSTESDCIPLKFEDRKTEKRRYNTCSLERSCQGVCSFSWICAKFYWAPDFV